MRFLMVALVTAMLSVPAAGAEPPLSTLATGALKNVAVDAAPKPVADASFRNAAGDEMDFSAFRGRVVLVNIWATWCAPCRHEMPSLARLQAARGGKDFEVVAVSVDRGGVEKAQGFLDEVGATALTLYIDQTTRIGRALGAFGLPLTLVLDREGREVARLVGPAEWDSPEALAFIDAVIAGAGS
ncbi:MAG: TlpA disulfide reductase family protein [Pseudomonadota bacterium]|nr:TlpA disulfide reductase family protein [Pseudomonadota bacterium]